MIRGVQMAIYDLLSKMVILLGQKVFVKESVELFYWKWRKLKEKRLRSDHFEYFYTNFFQIKKEHYKGKKVLDLGCGPRGSLNWAESAKERIGLDPLAAKYQDYLSEGNNMRWVKGYAENIPYPNSYFDVISCFNSLDHFQNLEKSISEITRVLKPKGKLLIITDIHKHPKICEPLAIPWKLYKKFEPFFRVRLERHYEGGKIYQSIKKGVPFDHSNQKGRYGILTLYLEKKVSNYVKPYIMRYNYGIEFTTDFNVINFIY